MNVSKIMIVDDEKAVCQGCRIVLSEKGYKVDVCMEGRAGLNAVLKGEYDLVLLDMKLPDIDGMDILQSVREAKPLSFKSADDEWSYGVG